MRSTPSTTRIMPPSNNRISRNVRQVRSCYHSLTYRRLCLLRTNWIILRNTSISWWTAWHASLPIRSPSASDTASIIRRTKARWFCILRQTCNWFATRLTSWVLRWPIHWRINCALNRCLILRPNIQFMWREISARRWVGRSTAGCICRYGPRLPISGSGHTRVSWQISVCGTGTGKYIWI